MVPKKRKAAPPPTRAVRAPKAPKPPLVAAAVEAKAVLDGVVPGQVGSGMRTLPGSVDQGVFSPPSPPRQWLWTQCGVREE